MDKNQRVLYGEIVSRAWDDEAFKKRFLTSPEEVLKEAGIIVEEGVEYKVIETPKLVQYLVLPHEKQQEATQELAKLLLAKAEQAQPIVPEGLELRIIQNTDSIRYLILPASPKTLTAAELKMISGGGLVSTHVVLIAEVAVAVGGVAAVAVVEAQSVATTTTAVAEVEAVVVAVGVVVLV